MSGQVEGRDALEVSVAIKAQNPDLETAWQTIAWWEQTCDFWHDQADEWRRRAEQIPAIEAAAEQRGREAGAAHAREQVAQEIEAVEHPGGWVAKVDAARIARGDA